jgi:hypothetical protein
VQPPCRRASHPLDVALRAIGSPSAPSPFVSTAAGPRAEPDGVSLDLSCLRQRVRDHVDLHLIVAGGLTRPTGDLGLQLIRIFDHVETSHVVKYECYNSILVFSMFILDYVKRMLFSAPLTGLERFTFLYKFFNCETYSPSFN